MFDHLTGIGVDLCTISRIAEAIKRPHFVSRIYTPAEQEYLDARGALRGQSAAGLFAAKEAVAKALGTGFAHGVAPWLIEIGHDDFGAPVVHLHEGAKERLEQMGGKAVLVSISHEGDNAIAFALIKG